MKKSSSNLFAMLLLAGFWMMIVSCQGRGLQGSPSGSFPFLEVARFDDINFKELSGIVYHPGRKTLFAVGDKGYITELRLDGTMVTQKRVRKGADFEGITCEPQTGLLYVAVEGEDKILEVNPEVLEVTREIPVNRQFENRLLLDPGGNGLEGITFVSHNPDTQTRTFYLVNQSKELEGPDPSVVLEVEVKDKGDEPANIVRYFSTGVAGLSGIHYDPSSDQLLIISDEKDVLLVTNLRGRIASTYPLPGKNQEGITVDEDGFLYIAQDSDKGLLKFKPL